MGYSNFKDPFGLLKRMLLSRNRIAYSILMREVFGWVIVPFDFILQVLEKKRIKESKNNSADPVILILGGSRSGTTLLYQTLVYYLPVSYISNFIASFHRSPISAFKLFNRILPKPNKSFQSYYGSVAGMGAPNDAFSIWNRWFGQDRNHIPKDISPQSKSEMKKFFDAWFSVSKKPFLNKNNRNSLCAPLLDSILKNVFFIEIHRDPVFVAQSLVISRRAVQGSDKIGWGLLSKDTENGEDPLHYIEDICNQVYEVDKILAYGRGRIDSKKYLRVSYESFCKNPGKVIQKIGIETMNYKIDSKDLMSLRFSTGANKQRLGDSEFNRICSSIDKLYTNNFPDNDNGKN